jgi:basic membrane protein A
MAGRLGHCADRQVWMVVLFCCVLVLSGCSGDKTWKPGAPLERERIIIAVLYNTNPQTETSGYSFSHEAGILEMQRELGLREDQILRKPLIIDGDAEGTENAVRDCVAAGAHVIIATSWGYMDSCEKLAAEFPRVVFAHASGYKRNDSNFTNYFGRVYQARYLAGVAAGLKTRTNKIGYVAAMGRDNSEVTGGIDAFALGVERVNPAARVFVRVTYSWFDPMGEADAARALIAEGCDVLGQHCDSAAPQTEAEKAGVWGIGYNSDMSDEAPGAVLTSVVWRWGVYYTHFVRGVLDGSFTTAPYLGGLAEGMVDIVPLAAGLAAPDTAAVVEAERKRIVEGGFRVFEGALYTNDGRLVNPGGAPLEDEEILTGINWYYRNVIER